MKIEDNPYATAEAVAEFRACVPDALRRAEIVQSARNLLPDDDAWLPAGAVRTMATIVNYLNAHNLVEGGAYEDYVSVAETVLHLALDMRAEGKPKIPER